MPSSNRSRSRSAWVRNPTDVRLLDPVHLQLVLEREGRREVSPTSRPVTAGTRRRSYALRCRISPMRSARAPAGEPRQRQPRRAQPDVGAPLDPLGGALAGEVGPELRRAGSSPSPRAVSSSARPSRLGWPYSTNARGPFAIEKPTPCARVAQGRSATSTARSFVSCGTSGSCTRSAHRAEHAESQERRLAAARPARGRRRRPSETRQRAPDHLLARPAVPGDERSARSRTCGPSSTTKRSAARCRSRSSCSRASTRA